MLRKCLPNCLPGLWPLWLQLSPDRRLTHSPHGGGRERSTRCGKGLGSQTQGSPSPGSLGLRLSHPCWGGHSVQLLPGDDMMLSPAYFP